MLEWLNDNIIWGAPMLILYLLVGTVFSVKLKFGQITRLKEVFSRTLFSKNKGKADSKNLSPLQTLTSALATTLGTGNIVAVGSAVAIGGAGAVFWMLVSAILGMATCYAENVLGMKYRQKREDGSWFGGAFHYISAAFGSVKAGKLYAFFCMAASVGIGNMTQINAMAGSLDDAFGISPVVSGSVAAILLLWLIFGGIKLFGKVTEKVIPLISLVYVAGCIGVIALNISHFPSAVARIFSEAFDFRAASGGFFGSAMMLGMSWGVRRGIFSNEAGLGSSVMLNSATTSEDGEKQGMWSMLQVFFDTIVMCTLTAMTLLVTGADRSATDGLSNAVSAFRCVFGSFSSGFVAIAITVFAITTAAGWSVYGSNSLEYLTGGKGKNVFLFIFASATVLGAVMKIDIVWQLSDLLNGLMAMPNLPAMLILSNQVSGFSHKEIGKNKSVGELSVSRL